MPKIVIKGAYANVDELELDGLSSGVINFYINELDHCVKKPGLGVYADLGTNLPVRGLYFFAAKKMVFAVSGTKVFRIVLATAEVTDITGDPISATNIPIFTDDGTTVWIACGGRLLTCSDTTNTTYVADADAPTDVTHVCYLDGYILCNNVGTPYIHYTEVGNRTSWKALDFMSAESNPDNVVALYVMWNEIYAFGTLSLEVFRNDGVTPFSRISGASYAIGIAAPYAGVMFGDDFYFLDHTRLVRKLGGRQVTAITNNYYKYVSSFSNISTVVAEAVVVSGQGFVKFNFIDSEFSMVYNPRLDKWQQWAEWNGTTYQYLKDSTMCATQISFNSTGVLFDTIEVKNANTITTTVSGVNKAWSDITNIVDGNLTTYGTCTFTGAGEYSDYLYLTNFSFAIVDGSVIIGIIIYFDIIAEHMAGDIIVDDVILYTHLGAIGVNQATELTLNTDESQCIILSMGDGCMGQSNSTNRRVLYYGGITNLWGAVLFPAAINLTTFGLRVRFKCTNYTYGITSGTQPQIKLCNVGMKVYSNSIANAGAINTLHGSARNDGKIYVMIPNKVNDDTRVIRSTVRSGHITHGTLALKDAQRLVIHTKLNPAIFSYTTPILKVRWKDDGNSWGAYIEIPLVAYGNSNNTYILDRLGTYRSRQYEFTHESLSECIFMEAHEYTTILEDTK